MNKHPSKVGVVIADVLALIAFGWLIRVSIPILTPEPFYMKDVGRFVCGVAIALLTSIIALVSIY